MDYELPIDFDLIVVGTGLIESIISAAASRIGKRVLHIDNNNHYGGYWASFNLNDINNLNTTETSAKPNDSENEKVYPLGNSSFHLKNFETKWHISDNLVLNEVSDKKTDQVDDNPKEEENTDHIKSDKSQPSKWTRESLLKESRKFCIDLTPKLQFARGDFVELLISSNIARYSEYRSVSRVLTWLNGQLETVPCSRSDVFSNNKVTVIEKRMLMKLFTTLDDEIKDTEGKTYKAFLKEKKLTYNLIHYVLYAISMSTDNTPCIKGIQNTKRFLNSLGRFGKTPFLFPMYGSGETAQAFCRLSAVFGGTYALNQTLHGLTYNDQNKFQSLICGKQTISAEHLVISIEKYPSLLMEKIPTNYISRAVFITDRTIMDSESEHLTLLLYPTEKGKNCCVILEVGTLTGTCPKDLYIVHFISKQQTKPDEDFKECINNLFDLTNEPDNKKPKVLWSCYFSIPVSNDLDLISGIPENVYICPGPDQDLDYDGSVNQAKEMFSKLYPDEEFLPRAPNPEEIIIEGEDIENQENDNTVEESNNIANTEDRCESESVSSVH